MATYEAVVPSVLLSIPISDFQDIQNDHSTMANEFEVNFHHRYETMRQVILKSSEQLWVDGNIRPATSTDASVSLIQSSHRVVYRSLTVNTKKQEEIVEYSMEDMLKHGIIHPFFPIKIIW